MPEIIQPVYITKNVEGDPVLMDIDNITRRAKIIQLRENLLAVEEDRAAGRNGCSIDDLDSFFEEVLDRCDL